MPGRKELKGVAHDLLGSFVSRNNDVRGGWGIGELYDHALWNRVQRVEIDLLNLGIAPSGKKFGPMVSQYSDMLSKLCRRKGITRSWIRGARIHIKFGIDPDCYIPYVTQGDPFKCVFEIEDDRGHKYAVQRLGRCLPQWKHQLKQCKENPVSLVLLLILGVVITLGIAILVSSVWWAVSRLVAQ
jgi:hypothetical protein